MNETQLKVRSRGQLIAIILLRLFIGWHFMYEGVIKLHDPAWTSKGYLLNASGPFKEFFRWLAADSIISIVDYLNIFGLVAIGIGLILGLYERLATLGGILLLLFYYLSQPPFPGVEQLATEGNYLLINKNLIEAAALGVLYYFPTGKYLGLDGWFSKQSKP
jgi:thiosulfate dehydrogenase [quinone] large subunit